MKQRLRQRFQEWIDNGNDFTLYEIDNRDKGWVDQAEDTGRTFKGKQNPLLLWYPDAV